jgi:hypothetical protein
MRSILSGVLACEKLAVRTLVGASAADRIH